MATVTAPTIARKVFRAVLDDQPGMLGLVDSRLLFFADDAGATMTWIEPAHVGVLVVLGEIGLADAQAAQDRMAGGYAWIATHRAQEVA